MRTASRLVGLFSNPYVFVGFCILFAIMAEYASRGTVQMWSFVVINVLLAQSINLLTGVTGQISLGQAGYFALGAYASALAMKLLGVYFPVAVVLAVLFTALIGAIISFPSGRVREFYLAMMSLAFGLIVYEIIREWRGLTGGVMGLRGMPSASIGTLHFLGVPLDGAGYFRLLLAVLAAVMFMLHNFLRSHHGRAFYAVHNSEIGAAALGVSQSLVKLQAYALSAGIAGLAGALYAHLVSYLTPESFSLMRSIEILVMSIVGGLGSLSGQFMGAVVFTYLPQQLQAFSDYQYIIYGLILMFAFVVFPKGIAGFLRVRTLYSRHIETQSPEALRRLPEPITPRQPAVERTPENALLSVSDIEMEFAGLRALDGVSLDLFAGSVTALVGPNGSGKTTLVNVISGIFTPTRGTIVYAGQDITSWPAHRVASAGLTRTFQDPRNVAGFTVRENVVMGANRIFRAGIWSAALSTPRSRAEERRLLIRTDQLMLLSGLDEYAAELMGDLPYGIQRLAEVVRALASDPDLLMLDEPAAGLSEQESEQLIRLIRLAVARGIAVLVIDHHMDFLADIADEVIVLEAGKEIYHGDMAGMRQDRRVIEAYLGEEGNNA